MSPIAVHIDAQLNVFGTFGLQVRIGFDIKQGVGEIEPHFIGGGRAEAGAVLALQGDRRADVPIQCGHIAGRTEACLLVPQAFGFKLAFHVGIETFRIQGVHFGAVVTHAEVQLKAVAEAQGVVPIKIRVIGLSADQEFFFITVGSQAVGIENVCPITGVAIGVALARSAHAVGHIPRQAFAEIEMFFGSHFELVGIVIQAAADEIVFGIPPHSLDVILLGNIPSQGGHADFLSVEAHCQLVPRPPFQQVFVFQANAAAVGHVLAVAVAGAVISTKQIRELIRFPILSGGFVNTTQIVAIVEVIAEAEQVGMIFSVLRVGGAACHAAICCITKLVVVIEAQIDVLAFFMVFGFVPVTHSAHHQGIKPA